MTDEQTSGSASDSESLALIVAYAEKAVQRQATRLDEHRARAATLFSAAAIASGFLGSRAFAQSQPGGWATAGAIFFAATGIALVYVVWPREWRFGLDVNVSLQYVLNDRPPASKTYQRAATGWQSNYEHNEPILRRVTRSMAFMALLVAATNIAFFINLTGS